MNIIGDGEVMYDLNGHGRCLELPRNWVKGRKELLHFYNSRRRCLYLYDPTFEPERRDVYGVDVGSMDSLTVIVDGFIIIPKYAYERMKRPTRVEFAVEGNGGSLLLVIPRKEK